MPAENNSGLDLWSGQGQVILRAYECSYYAEPNEGDICLV